MKKYIMVHLKDDREFYFDLAALDSFGNNRIVIRRMNGHGAIQIEIKETLDEFKKKLKEAGVQIL